MHFPGLSSFRKTYVAEPCHIQKNRKGLNTAGCKNLTAVKGQDEETILMINN